MHERSRHRAFKIIGRIIAAGAALMLFAAIFLASYVLGIDEWRDFDPKTVAEMKLSTVLYDGGGEAYAVLSDGETRFYAPIESIPQHVKNAFLAIEDARFYEHGGFDIVRIGGAIIEDIKAGAAVQGASTISQQLVKTSVLKSSRSVGRKLTEIMMAVRLEGQYSKDDILELYLNRVYFGRGAYGVGAAARIYFGCDVSELTVAQGAMLAGILKSPTNYAPHINLQKSITRRNLVLSEMEKYGFITAAQKVAAAAEGVTLAEYDGESYPYGWFTDMALEEACSVLSISMSELLSGGYTINTTLDRDLQDAMDAKVELEDGIEAAGVAIDSKTGRILAVRGGLLHTARLGFSRATDMRRQPGSAIKPVMVFAPAIEYEHHTTTDFLLDAPESFGEYTPRNAGSGYSGWVTLRQAAEKSINIPAVKLLDEVGVDRAKAYASSVGIEFESRDNGLSLALGGFTTGVSPLELCAAYQPFASGGGYRDTGCINSIVGSDGKVLYERDAREYRVLSEESAFLTASLLKSSATTGTAKQVAVEGMDICAKTGTTRYDDADNNKDAWIVAFDPDIIVCCWMGCDKTAEGNNLPKGFTGGGEPAKFAKRIFEAQKAKNGGRAREFTAPEGIVSVYIDSAAIEERCEVRRVYSGSENAVLEWYVRGTEPRYYLGSIMGYGAVAPQQQEEAAENAQDQKNPQDQKNEQNQKSAQESAEDAGF